MAASFHILIADDDPDDRLIIREALRDYSKAVVISEVGNGRELVEMVKKQQIENGSADAIILDINMPVMDGTEALKILQASGLIKDIPVYILSTMRNKERVSEAMALGAICAYSKPNSMKAFQKIVSTIFKQSLS